MFNDKKQNKIWVCLECGKLNTPDCSFCEFCGQPRRRLSNPAKPTARPEDMAETVYCPVCGKECEGDMLFCVFCGSSLKKPPADTPVQEIAPEPPKPEKRIRCVHCGTMNEVQNRYCVHCAEEVRVEKKETIVLLEEQRDNSVATCPECGAHCDNSSAFCNECGARLSITRGL